VNLLKELKCQDTAVKFLKNSVMAGRTASSYLFTGREGVGKATAVKGFIKILMCENSSQDADACGVCPTCIRVDSCSHPDLNWIAPAKNGRIKIDTIRVARSRLYLKPYESRVLVCVIEQAHMMTQEASNALLKVLEEPPGEAMIILTSNKKDLLSATVISRCTEVRFSSLSISDTKDIIEGITDVGSQTAELLAWFSQGSPGKGVEAAAEGILERKTAVLKQLKEIASNVNYTCMNWDSDDKNTIINDLELMIMLLRDFSVSSEHLDNMVLDKEVLIQEDESSKEYYTAETSGRIINALIRIKRSLYGNINPKIVAGALPSLMHDYGFMEK